MQSAEQSFILAIDSFAGREDAVIKSLDDFRPKGVAGVTTLSNGQIVLILDMKELLGALGETRGVSRRILLAHLSVRLSPRNGCTPATLA
jgi:two-component system chemotaxis sensor kinase CheA